MSWFGRYVENQLQDLDSEGRPRHALEDLLGITETEVNSHDGIAALSAVLGTLKGR